MVVVVVESDDVVLIEQGRSFDYNRSAIIAGIIVIDVIIDIIIDVINVTNIIIIGVTITICINIIIIIIVGDVLLLRLL